MAQIVEAKSLYGEMLSEEQQDDQMIQITIYLELIDQIDACLKKYQDRYHELKNKKIKMLEDRKQRIINEEE